MASESLSPAPLDLSLITAQVLSHSSLDILFDSIFLDPLSSTKEQFGDQAAHTTSGSQAYYNYDG